MYLRETKSWRCEEEEEVEEGEEEKVSLLTHATARGMGKNKSIMMASYEWSMKSVLGYLE